MKSELEFLRDLKVEIIVSFCCKDGNFIKISDDSKPVINLINKRIVELMNNG